MPDQDKEHAFEELAKRRVHNKTLTRVDNTKLMAGDPMYFYCIDCGAEIEIPEDYLERPESCPPCTDMRKKGWLT